DIGKVAAVDYRLNGELYTTIGRNTTLRIGQEGRYTPSTLYGLFAQSGATATDDALEPLSDGVPLNGTYPQNTERWYNYVTTASLDQRISRRGILKFTSDFAYTDFVEKLPDTVNTKAYHAGTEFNYRLDRRYYLLFGYTYGRANFGGVSDLF